MRNMIFIGGIHGVGKSFFCENVLQTYRITNYSASELISQKKGEIFTADKKVGNISANQDLLIHALTELEIGNDLFLLDGHFCLISKNGTIERIPESTFIELSPRGIIVLVDTVERIAERIKRRDGVDREHEFIEKFQNEELRYSKEIADKLNIPHVVHEMTRSLVEVGKLFRFVASS